MTQPQPISLEEFNNAPSDAPKSISLDEFAAAKDESSDQSGEDPHSFGTAVSNFGSGLVKLGGNVLSAAAHPIDTAESLANTSPQDIVAGAYRSVRSTPMVGPLIDQANIAAQGIPAYLQAKMNPQPGVAPAAEWARGADDFEKRQAASDAAHAQDHPISDVVQKGLPWLATAPLGPAEQVGLMAGDTFNRSIAQGNPVPDALKDARNAAAIGSTMLGAGQAVSAASQPAAEALAHPITALKNASESLADTTTSAKGFSPIDLAIGAGEYATKLAAGHGNSTALMAGAAASAGAKFVRPQAAAAAAALTSDLAAGLEKAYGSAPVQLVKQAGISLQDLTNTPFTSQIMTAAANGPKSLAITHYLMSQQNPDYQRAMNKN